MWILVFQRIALEAVLDAFYFPLWWYTKGAYKASQWCAYLFADGNSRLAPMLWLKNIFVPMYGQYDWQGRIISFLMRFAQIIFRSFVLALWLLFCFLLFIVWLILPVLVVSGILNSFKLR